MDDRTCSVDGCVKPHKAHGWCHTHYMRWRRSGATDVPPAPTSEDRFWSKVDKDGPNGCWVWTAARCRDGYGVFSPRHSGQLKAHRFAYELLIGPIPDGLVIDHLCRNTACVNPAHLEPVTPKTNVLRGVSAAAQAKRRTHCIRGHEYTPENTSIYNGGNGRVGRRCLTCRREDMRVKRQRAREEEA